MKPKHLAIRIEQCIALSKASNCPRRKFGALLLDPERNVVLMDGYNGGPRGGEGDFCAGHFCARDGLKKSDFDIQPGMEHNTIGADGYWVIGPGGKDVFFKGAEGHDAALSYVDEQVAAFPSVQSGTRMEIGCHHAEMNVVCNAAANGVKTAGAWLIVTGEPCMMCSKLIHHAGIVKVFVVDGGYIGQNGVQYLRDHGVEVEATEGPKDPRARKTAEGV